MNVKSCITNIGFPKTISELKDMIENNDRQDCYSQTNVENILNEKFVKWTVPSWIKKDDIIFFYHSKSANIQIKNLLKSNIKEKRYKEILEKSLKLHEQYGGKIYAIGKMISETSREKFNKKSHYKGSIYGDIEIISVLKNPIDISEFSDFITITRGTITEVFGSDYEKLKKIIENKNKIPKWFEKTTSMEFGSKKINKNNFLKINSNLNYDFISEKYFRSYFTNYLLDNLVGKNYYTECHCYKKNKKTGIIDNIVEIDGSHIFIEIKLNIENEKDIVGQLKKYSKVEYFKPIKNNEQIFVSNPKNKILVIDRYKIYLFDEKDNFSRKEIEKIENLKDLKSIEFLKKKLIKNIF